jgi:CheY-like chemotaxis protein
VKNHDGYFQLSSEPGVGTTAAVYFPSAELAGEQKKKDENVELFLGKKVLVMDDEALIRSVLSKMLRRLGCRSSAAENGNEAVYLYQRAFDSGRPFDLVILDLTVPGGMGGKDAMVRIREIDPEARVMLSSGYSNDPVMADYERFGFNGVISKPYSLADLSSALGELFS